MVSVRCSKRKFSYIHSAPQLLRHKSAKDFPRQHGSASSSDTAPGILPTAFDAAAEAEHLEEPVTMTEIPVEGPPEELHLDESLRIRRMGRKALLLEAKSKSI